MSIKSLIQMWKNLPLKGYVYASLGLSLGSAIGIAAIHSFLPPVVPLFYGLPVGSDQLVPSFGLLFAPAVSLLITTLNLMLTIFTKDMFFKRTLVISSTFVAVLAVIAVLKIVFLVGFF